MSRFGCEQPHQLWSCLFQISTMQATRGKRKDVEQQNLSVPAKKRSGTLADVAEVCIDIPCPCCTSCFE